MRESSPTISKLKCPRRAPALFGILALALLQISIASHQFEHLADHGFSVCQSCSTYNQLGATLIPDALPIEFPIEPQLASDTMAQPFAAAPAFAAYRPRAPPHS